AAAARSLVVVAAIGLGSVLQVLVAGTLLQHFIGNRTPFGRAQDVFKFVGLAMLGCLVSPSCGATSLCLGGTPWTEVPATWWPWWVGDFVGVLVVTSLVLAWAAQPWPRWQSRRLLETGAGLALTVLVAYLVFGGAQTMGIIRDPLAYVLIPFVIWAAVRF